MKKLLLLVLIVALAVVWWLKRPAVPRHRDGPTPVNRNTELNEKVRALPPHLQRKVVDYLGEAGRFDVDTANRELPIAGSMSRVRNTSRLRAATADLPPELQKKLEQLPPSVRQKALDMLGEARQHLSQP